jgi:hypothetical protein
MNDVEITTDLKIERSLIGPETEIKSMTERGSGQFVLGRGTSLYI